MAELFFLFYEDDINTKGQWTQKFMTLEHRFKEMTDTRDSELTAVNGRESLKIWVTECMKERE
jgi:hypothetical protein